MSCAATDHRPGNIFADEPDRGKLFVSLELSKSKWLVTSLPAGGDKMSKHMISGGDWDALLALLTELRRRAEARLGGSPKIVSIHEAGLDGFSVHRMLEAFDVESHIVDPASIAVSRRTRRAKTDLIDGETLLRTLMAWMRGEPRVCSMVAPPSPEDEDCRRLSRERKRLVKERIEHVNRIKGLLSAQGIRGFEPLRRDRRERLDALRTPNDRFLPQHLKAEIIRELERLELIMRQITEVEGVRDALLLSDKKTIPAMTVKAPRKTEGTPESSSQASAKLLMQLKGIGPEFAAVLSLEGFYRHFENRRQLAAYTGLAPSPWQSGQVDRDQGISKAGNPRLRTAMIELAWLWQRYQPGSALTCWFRERVGSERGRIRRIAIVALARKLVVALWRFVTHGIVPEGAILKVA